MKLLFIPLLAASALAALVADPPVAELSNLTATAVLAWYAWHTATRTIPKLVDDFRTELATQRQQQRTDLESFLHELAEERSQRHADNAAMVGAVGELTALLGRIQFHKPTK